MITTSINRIKGKWILFLLACILVCIYSTISITNNFANSQKKQCQIFQLTDENNSINNLSELLFNTHRRSVNLLLFYKKDSVELLSNQEKSIQLKKEFSENLEKVSSTFLFDSLRIDSLVSAGRAYLSCNLVYTQILYTAGVDSAVSYKTNTLRPSLDQFFATSKRISNSISARINSVTSESGFPIYQFILLLIGLVPILFFLLILFKNILMIKMNGLFQSDIYFYDKPA